MGKQTVAEAACSRGAPLDAYTDPASEDDDERQTAQGRLSDEQTQLLGGKADAQQIKCVLLLSCPMFMHHM